jgi:hypothetical protein
MQRDHVAKRLIQLNPKLQSALAPRFDLDPATKWFLAQTSRKWPRSSLFWPRFLSGVGPGRGGLAMALGT